MSETHKFAGFNSRTQQRIANNLGIISSGLTDGGRSKFRKPVLDLYDAYYEKRQYEKLPEWDQDFASDLEYIPVRKRKPRLNYGFAKVLSSRVASKLVSKRNFPVIKIEDDPHTEELIRLLIQKTFLRAKLVEPIRRMLVAGSVFVRFRMVDGTIIVNHYLSKWTYPELDEKGDLVKARIQYVFDDEKDKDEHGVPKKKWFRLDLGQMTDISYDNPEFNHEQEPQFKVVESVDHNLGFVQGEWFRTGELTQSVDGPALIQDILDFMDEMNYTLSSSSTAVEYNQDPQLIFKNMDEDEIENLIKSSVKGWNVGREGEASFLEAGMQGVQTAFEFSDKVRLNIQDLSRVVLMDPEKIVGSAQSAKALEVLHGPLVELVEELQPQLEKNIVQLILKMLIVLLTMNQSGLQTMFEIPPTYKPISLNLTANWPEIFPMTMEDLQKKVGVAVQAASANIFSRETMMGWLAKDFGVEDIEEEKRRVDTQPVINPFGAF